MRFSLKKGSELVTIDCGTWDVHLHAKNFEYEAAPEEVIFSMDLSRNQRMRNDTNAKLDAQKLTEHLEKIAFIQIHGDNWLKPLGKALTANPEAVLIVELLFDKDFSHSCKYISRIENGSLFLDVVRAD